MCDEVEAADKCELCGYCKRLEQRNAEIAKGEGQ